MSTAHPGIELLKKVKKRNRMFHPTAHRRRHDTRFGGSHLDAVTQATPYNEHLAHRILVDREVRQTAAPPWSRARRPTHFVAVRVPVQSHMAATLEGLREDAASSGLGAFVELFTPLARLHMTLAVATLDGFEPRAVAAGGPPTGPPVVPAGDDDGGGTAPVVPPPVDGPADGPADAGPADGGPADAAVAGVPRRDRLELVAVSSRAEQQLSTVNTIVSAALAELAARPVTVRFQGLGTFADGRVVFARPTAVDGEHRRLMAIVQAMRRDLGRAGIDIKGNPFDDFVPHATVAKINAEQQRRFSVRKVPTTLFDHAMHFDFGILTVRSAQVCALKGAGADGYYNVVHST